MFYISGNNNEIPQFARKTCRLWKQLNIPNIPQSASGFDRSQKWILVLLFLFGVEGGCGGGDRMVGEVVLERSLLEENEERGKMIETEMKSISRS